MSSAQPSAPAPSFFASPIGLALLCYGVWGFAPLAYLPLKALGATAFEIMAHRSVWALIWAGGLVYLTKQMRETLSYFLTPKIVLTLFVAALMISINWGVFVWAVTNAHTIEASLGYYLNPLLNMAAGAVLFKERLDNWGKASIAMAVTGVVVQIIALHHVPYIALILAFSFATYGIIRKQLVVSALGGLFVECVFLFVPSIIYLIWLETSGQGHFGHSGAGMFWFALTGPVTVLPLFLFSYVARRLPLSTMGFIQFIAPTIAFFIGLCLGEPFKAEHAVSFLFIWSGALVFAFGAWRRAKLMRVG